ncbi:hypothetical protein [Halomonas alkalisoli]|uniref:hypothetical protein n=1 Tax=Halomonas alkalisoli TaxID=2907158 RepID=UPI001F392513|nr:hypothetical protein [Halomonas alkalisoli]MCE9682901.1 hypothetical protein [Halomonas alkalisoli]
MLLRASNASDGQVQSSNSLISEVSLGGDADTQACMAGAMAEAYHGGLPKALHRERDPHPAVVDLRQVVDTFTARFLPG